MRFSPVPLSDPEFMARPVEAVRACTVWQLTSQHQVWNDQKNHLYQGAGSLHNSMVSVDLAITERRKAGTYFNAQQLPAIEFQVGDESIVLLHINTDIPFRRWEMAAAPRQSMDVAWVRAAFWPDYRADPRYGWPTAGQETHVLGGLHRRPVGRLIVNLKRLGPDTDEFERHTSRYVRPKKNDWIQNLEELDEEYCDTEHLHRVVDEVRDALNGS